MESVLNRPIWSPTNGSKFGDEQKSRDRPWPGDFHFVITNIDAKLSRIAFVDTS